MKAILLFNYVRKKYVFISVFSVFFDADFKSEVRIFGQKLSILRKKLKFPDYRGFSVPGVKNGLDSAGKEPLNSILSIRKISAIQNIQGI